MSISDPLRVQAIVDYGEQMKMRNENNILYDKITSYISIQFRNVIIIMIILYYFRNLIINTQYENQNKYMKENQNKYMKENQNKNYDTLSPY